MFGTESPLPCEYDTDNDNEDDGDDTDGANDNNIVWRYDPVIIWFTRAVQVNITPASISKKFFEIKIVLFLGAKATIDLALFISPFVFL